MSVNIPGGQQYMGSYKHIPNYKHNPDFTWWPHQVHSEHSTQREDDRITTYVVSKLQKPLVIPNIVQTWSATTATTDETGMS